MYVNSVHISMFFLECHGPAPPGRWSVPLPQKTMAGPASVILNNLSAAHLHETVDEE